AKIQRLREELGVSPHEMAERIGINIPSYYDLELIPHEWEMAVDLNQLISLAHILGIPLLELLGESGGDMFAPLSFPEIAKLIRDRIAEGKTSEERIGWDLTEF